MRKIQTTDVFEAMRLIQKSGLRDQLTPVIRELSDKGADTVDAGITGILTIIEVFAAERCETMIYELLARICETTADEVATYDLDKLAEVLTTIAEENNLRAFFSALAGLLSRKH